MRKISLSVFAVFTVLCLAAAEFTGEHDKVPAGTLQIAQIDFADEIGDSYIIRTPENRVILLDAGRANTAESHLIPALNKHKITHIDTVILTHFHIDHVGGIYAVLSDPGITIGEILYSSMPEKDIPGEFTLKVFRRIMMLADRGNIPVRKLEVGDRIDFGGGIYGDVFGAAQAGSKDYNLNSHSLVFKMHYKDFTALFTGDCSLQEESRIFAGKFDLKSDLLKVAHHAGINNTSKEFLDAVSPKAAMVDKPLWLSKDSRSFRVEGMIREREIPFYRAGEYPQAVFFSDGRTFGVCVK